MVMTTRRITGPKAAISCTGRDPRTDRRDLGTLAERGRLLLGTIDDPLHLPVQGR